MRGGGGELNIAYGLTPPSDTSKLWVRIADKPNEVTVKAMDENMKPRLVKGTELLARAICHECDHLDGKLYVDLVEGELEDNEEA